VNLVGLGRDQPENAGKELVVRPSLDILDYRLRPKARVANNKAALGSVWTNDHDIRWTNLLALGRPEMVQIL
jgi:hypothetical protein